MISPFLRTKFYTLVLLTVCFALSADVSGNLAHAQHEGHDMSNTPGMNKPKPKKKPAPKRRATPRRSAPRQTPAPAPAPAPSVDDNAQPEEPEHRDMPGMNNPATVKPSPNTATPAAPQTETKEGTTPAAPADHTMHREAPASAPAPAAEPWGTTVPAAPAQNSAPSNATEATPSSAPATGHEGHDAGSVNAGEAGGEAPASDPHGSMPGMDMSGSKTSGVGRIEGDLMEMNGEQMNIVLRASTTARNSISMGQMGSGSSWQPATTPMYMWYTRAGRWLLFLHGDMKLGVNAQGGPRGVAKFESQNWIMPMAFTRVGRGTLQLRGMFSLEPFSFPPGGSPLLFQTGETYKGQPIIDKQHPHDLFMELSGTYTVPIGERGTWFTYIGFPGEPALGPTAFMHRWSASENPSAPLSHHLQDSTHISFGVFTTGFTYRWLKVEGSLFNGREPDENRYNFEFNPWTSRSFRLSFAPNDNWAMQVSYGVLKNPEALEAGDVRRVTASLSYNKRFARGNWASSLVWGRNRELHHLPGQTLNGYVAESTVNFLDRNYLYTRLELVDKGGLLNDDERAQLGIADHHPLFRIGAYTFGAARDVWNTEKLSVAIGSDITFYSKPDTLDPIYGNRPTSYRFFIRLRPSRMSMSGHGHTGH